MKKKLVVAVAISLIIANGSTVAMATGGSDDSSTTSTTVPRTQNEGIARYKVELAQYLQTRHAINTAFVTAIVNAQRDFKVARESATDRQSINIATRARLAAVQTAAQTKNAALRALGAPPVKP